MELVALGAGSEAGTLHTVLKGASFAQPRRVIEEITRQPIASDALGTLAFHTVGTGTSFMFDVQVDLDPSI